MIHTYGGMIFRPRIAVCALCDDQVWSMKSKRKLIAELRHNHWRKVDGIWICSRHDDLSDDDIGIIFAEMAEAAILGLSK